VGDRATMGWSLLCELYIVCTAVCGVEVSSEGVQWGTERR